MSAWQRIWRQIETLGLPILLALGIGVIFASPDQIHEVYRAAAQAFAHSGAAVMVSDVNDEGGQETVALSTTPAWVTAEGQPLAQGRVEPRPMTVRVFAARTARGWRFMPGGYARIGRA